MTNHNNHHRRRFNGQERAALYLASGGNCAACGMPLLPGWHADHKHAYARGGVTDVVNGQALCPTCNMKKGSKGEIMADTTAARQWQKDATEKFWDAWYAGKRQWLTSATPGAGKTRWALSLARELIDRRLIDRVVIVVPTRHLVAQWINHAPDNALPILQLTDRDNISKKRENSDYHGVVITYQQLLTGSLLQRTFCGQARTLVISDELHHAGFPQSWGTALRDAFEGACTAHIGLTGTPWRSFGQIPFVTYNKTTKVVETDASYSYSDAVRDRVCRVVQFHAFDAKLRYIDTDSCGSVAYEVLLSQSEKDDEDNSRELLQVLDPDKPWLDRILRQADATLVERITGSDGEAPIPDAKGLVIALKQDYAAKIKDQLERITRQPVALIISDPDNEYGSNKAPEELKAFREGRRGRWAVAVDMFSEGVDVPSLLVGVYATNKRTALRFRQIVGRFVRIRPEENTSAVLFIPAVSSLLTQAKSMNDEVALALKQRMERAQQSDLLEDDERQPKPLHPEAVVSEPEGHSVIDTGMNADLAYNRYEEGKTLAVQFGIPARYAAEIYKLAASQRGTTTVADTPTEAPSQRRVVSLTAKEQSDQLSAEIKRYVSALAMQQSQGDIDERNRAIVQINTDIKYKFGQRDDMTIDQKKRVVQALKTAYEARQRHDEIIY